MQYSPKRKVFALRTAIMIAFTKLLHAVLDRYSMEYTPLCRHQCQQPWAAVYKISATKCL